MMGRRIRGSRSRWVGNRWLARRGAPGKRGSAHPGIQSRSPGVVDHKFGGATVVSLQGLLQSRLGNRRQAQLSPPAIDIGTQRLTGSQTRHRQFGCLGPGTCLQRGETNRSRLLLVLHPTFGQGPFRIRSGKPDALQKPVPGRFLGLDRFQAAGQFEKPCPVGTFVDGGDHSVPIRLVRGHRRAAGTGGSRDHHRFVNGHRVAG